MFAIHWRCSESAGYTMLRLHNCCSWTHPSHMLKPLHLTRSKYFGHLASISPSLRSLSSHNINNAIHLNPVQDSLLRRKINPLNQSSHCCYWRAEHLLNLSAHKSSMRSLSGRAMMVMAFLLFYLCAALLCCCGRYIDENKEHLAVMNCEAKWPMSAMNDSELNY